MNDIDLIIKTIEWTFKSSAAIHAAGGDIKHVLEKFPPELLNILIRNNIILRYEPDGKVK